MKLAEKITSIVVMSIITAASVVSVINMAANDNNKITLKNIANGESADILSENIAADFFFGNELRSAAAQIGAKAGEPLVNGVYITEDRLLSIDEHSLSEGVNCANAVNAFAKDYEGAVYFTAVPTSAGIYGDKLPSYLISVTEKQISEEILQNLDVKIRPIDAYTILKNLSENYIYYRSDTKWTSYGAYCVYRTVAQKLGFIPVSYDKYAIRHVSDNYCGNLYSRTGYMESRGDIIDIYEYDDGTEIVSCKGTDSQGVVQDISLYDMEALKSDNPYDLYLGKDMDFIEIETTVNNEKSLLVIGDETADCLIPFLTKHYNEIDIVSVDCFNGGSVEHINKADYEQTLFILGMEHISEKFKS